MYTQLGAETISTKLINENTYLRNKEALRIHIAWFSSHSTSIDIIHILWAGI